MTTSSMRQKLYEYIKVADDKKVKAMYTIVAEGTEPTPEWWEDKELVAKLDSINDAMETGSDKGIDWNEAKHKLALRNRK